MIFNTKIREEAPKNGNKYYTSIDYGGLNSCESKNNGFILPNDVAYVHGRIMEYFGMEKDMLCVSSAYDFYETEKLNYKTGKTPKEGAIAYWTNKDKSFNHVGFVEKVLEDGRVIFSNSGNIDFYKREISQPYSYKGGFGEMTLIDFIYIDSPISNSLNTIENETDTLKEEVKNDIYKEKTLNELAQEVIDGKWGFGVNRLNRLTKAYKKGRINFSYDEVQNKVIELLGTETDSKEKIE